jgi:hypothetical protein
LARLALLSACRQVLENGLKVLGVSAPSKMWSIERNGVISFSILMRVR